jgi:hypothetical protein
MVVVKNLKKIQFNTRRFKEFFSLKILAEKLCKLSRKK